MEYDFYSMLFNYSLKLLIGLLHHKQVISGQACEREAGEKKFRYCLIWCSKLDLLRKS